MTGLNRQILFKEGEGRGPHPAAPFVAVFSLGMLVLSLSPALSGLSAKKPFLMDFHSYAVLIIALLAAYAACTAFTPLRKFTPAAGFLALLSGGYLLSEVLYRACPITGSSLLPALPVGPAAARHLRDFLLHRLYHGVPLLIGMAYFWAVDRSLPASFLGFGSLREPAASINSNHPQAWSRVILKMAILIVAVALVKRAVFPPALQAAQPGGWPWALWGAIALYALWNCLVEELLFRGMLMGLLAGPAGSGWANRIQAVIFALSHVDPFSWLASGIRVLVLAFLGWLFGRAAIETKGIGASWIIHSMIVLAIEMGMASP
jgi:membrane protease YdiL (CAAX protease family)